MYELTFSCTDTTALVCDRHADPEVLDYVFDLADISDTSAQGDCLVCWDSIFLDMYEREAGMLRDDVLLAIFNIACDWHGGQFSRGYRVLCRARRLLERRGVDLATPADATLLAEWGERLTRLPGF